MEATDFIWLISAIFISLGVTLIAIRRFSVKDRTLRMRIFLFGAIGICVLLDIVGAIFVLVRPFELKFARMAILAAPTFLVVCILIDVIEGRSGSKPR